MNLNFIQDNDKVHVQTQNQIQCNQQLILKAKLMREDYQDYSQINPSLQQINGAFSSIVKEIYEHTLTIGSKIQNLNSNINKDLDKNANQISNKKISTNQMTDDQEDKQFIKKKKVSIPYGTLKKLQALRLLLGSSRRLIETQNGRYYTKNINRQNEKNSQIKFYKSVLKSYEVERQYFKKCTHEMQGRVQVIEDQMTKLASYNENNSFTDFQSKIIEFEYLPKYEKKFSSFQRALSELQLLTNARNKIQELLSEQKDNVFMNQKPTDKVLKTKQNSQNSQINVKAYGRTLSKSALEIAVRLNMLHMQKIQFVIQQRKRLKKVQGRTSQLNQLMKKAILQLENEKYFVDLQENILNFTSNSALTLSQRQGFETKLTSQTKLASKQGQKQISNKRKITKTDYMIYLKQIQKRIKEYFKTKDVMYRYKRNGQTVRSKSSDL